MKHSYIAFIIGFLLYSCTESSVTIHDAQMLSINDVRRHSGYLWFDIEYNHYQPEQLYIDSIKLLFNEEYHRVYFFAKPSCACELSQEYFPFLVKVLHRAGVSDSCLIVYSMSSPESPFPESIYFQVNTIPTIYLTNLYEPKAVITDTINHRLKLNPNEQIKVEQILYECLK